MDNIDLDVLQTAAQWHDAGEQTVLGTVVHTWGSAPRPIGSLVAIRNDGRIAGSVSGGCIEDDLNLRAEKRTLPKAATEIVTYGVTADEAQRFGLPCGGTLQLVLEPLSERSQLQQWLAAIRKEGLVNRRLDLATGLATLIPGNPDGFHFDDRTLVSVHGTAYRLLIIGAGQMSKCLATMAIPLGYEVIVCDPRKTYTQAWQFAGTLITTESRMTRCYKWMLTIERLLLL